MPQVDIKHAGKAYKVEFDPNKSATDFKDAIYQVTGVPSDRMKVMIASKLLKDTDDLSKLSIKPGQVVTVIGTAGPLPSAPSKPIVFLEDMPESQLAAIRPPLGLQNLGNTCYMNASLQAIRTIPELDPALREYRLNGPSGADKDAAFTQSLKTLFGTMREKTVSDDYVVPLLPLTSLRQVAPQFSEQDPHGGYSQQDADEMWTQTISSLHHALRPAGSSRSFVDQYLSADLQQTLTCDEAPEEPPTTKVDRVLKLDCNISIETNHLLTGIKDKITAFQTANQFDDTKKAKIMRRVEFPFELDVFDLLSDDLKKQVAPIRDAVRESQKAKEDRAKIRRRTHKAKKTPTAAAAAAAPGAASSTSDAGSGSVTPMEVDKLEDEATIQQRDKEKIQELVRKTIGEENMQPGTNWSGLYELSGHYIAWARQEARDDVIPGEEDWYKFDDDKVSVVKKDKIQALAGGGEDSVAYIMLYRAVV
ncbi:hypothetical protein QFC21_006740 [Naganishia friedmannii]|uniref:Uncharacterized protein n=1 Tax=Naganishia friedmannii TaxID=89922 RepID=A0ACC2V0M2_9TREE|nr:hypothetical protein QFC21_006740 [Naganishia friedmannii]